MFLFIFLFLFILLFLFLLLFFCCFYFHGSNVSVNILCIVTTVNIDVSVSVNTVNVTKYLNILVSITIGISDGGSGGWYIWLTTFILTWLITIMSTSSTDAFKVRPGKNEQKQFHNKWAGTSTSNGHISNIWRFKSFEKIRRNRKVCNRNNFLLTYYIVI